MSDLDKIKLALIAGSEYYGVAYPVGAQIVADGGSYIVYDHMNRIITSNINRKILDRLLLRAKVKASKEMDRCSVAQNSTKF